MACEGPLPRDAPRRRSGRSARARGLAVWERFLEAYSAVSRELERDLSAHGLTANDYAVLLRLRRAGPRGLRPAELARAVLLTRSGLTRLVDRLATAGLVERAECPEDLRGSYVRLTAAGRTALRRAYRTQRRRIDELFVVRLDEAELNALGALLDRLPRSEPAPGGRGAADGRGEGSRGRRS